MNYGVVCIVKKRPCNTKLKQFLELLQRTNGSYHACFVSNNFPEIRNILRSSSINDYTVYNNSGHVPYPTMLNQGLKNCSHCDYVTCFNMEHSIIADANWLDIIDGNDFDIAGNCEDIFINNQNSSIVEAISSSAKNDDLSWLVSSMHGDRLLRVVNKNLFIVKSECLKTNGYFKNINEFMLEFSMRLYRENLKIKNLKEVYSVDNDVCRKDIGNKIQEGALLLHPVVVNKIRQRFIER